jgi:hypothetical protein
MTNADTHRHDRTPPAGETAPTCERCGDAFPTEDLLALHRGLSHLDDLTPAERAAFDEAHEAETSELRLFRLKAVGAVVLLYFGFLAAYALIP